MSHNAININDLELLIRSINKLRFKDVFTNSTPIIKINIIGESTYTISKLGSKYQIEELMWNKDTKNTYTSNSGLDLLQTILDIVKNKEFEFNLLY